MLLCLLIWVWYLTCFLKCPSQRSFSEQGRRSRVALLPCRGISVYHTITSRAMRVIWDGCSVLLSCPYLGTAFENPLIIVGRNRRELFSPVFHPHFLLQACYQFLKTFNFPRCKVGNPCGRNLHGVRHGHRPTQWQWCQWNENRLLNSGNMKIIFFPPYQPVEGLTKTVDRSDWAN